MDQQPMKLLDLARNKVADSVKYNELQTLSVREPSKIFDIVAQSIIKENYAKMRVDGLLELVYGVAVGTQWRLPENAEKYDPSAIFVVKDVGASSGHSELCDVVHELKEHYKSRPIQKRPWIRHMYVPTTTRFPFPADTCDKFAQEFPQFMESQSTGNGIALFVQHTNKDKFLSDKGELWHGSKFVARGPEEVPVGAFTTAMAHTSMCHDISVDCLAEYVRLRCPVTYDHVTEGLWKFRRAEKQLITQYNKSWRSTLEHWETLDNYDDRHTFKNDRGVIIEDQLTHAGIEVYAQF